MHSLLRTLDQGPVWAFFLVLARVSPLFVVAPLFSSRMLPARAKGICAVALAVGLMPIAGRGAGLPHDVLSYAALALKEVLVGLALAFALAVVMAALTVAGSFLDTLSGFAFASLGDPFPGVQATVLSQLYGLFGVLIFIAIGGDGWVIRGLGETYHAVPLTAAPALGSLLAGAQRAFVTVFTSALEVAAPVVVALTITDAAFGMVSRAVPQLNVFVVALPAKILVGLLVIGASLPFVAGWLSDQLEQSVAVALRSLRLA